MSILKYLKPGTTDNWNNTVSVRILSENKTIPDQLIASSYPNYITPEVMDMVERVNAVRKNDSIVFVAMSDSHYCADQTEIQNAAETNASALQANQAAKALSYLIKPDFLAHLGDVSCGHASTTPEMLKKQIEGFNRMFCEARSYIPVFIAIGNHDTGIYYHWAQADGDIHTLDGEYLFNKFTALSASSDTVFGSRDNGGYCYRDFPEKKLRVFLLNTSEGQIVKQSDNSPTSISQRKWLADSLIDLNTKEDSTEWSFMILSHYPADYGATMPLSELLKAYVEGTSFDIIDITNSGTSHIGTVNFQGYNGAKMIAQFHGHVHNFLTDKLYNYATGSGVQYDAHRLCIPNGEYYRHNYYTTVGSYTDINFKEETDYPKTANTADGTSFVVNVINPSEQIIYSFCYGAGYDRVIGYASTVYYAITSTLSYVRSSNYQRSIEGGGTYETLLTVNDGGYSLKSVKITMDGVDITDQAFDDITMTINIPEVTGNVAIVARAELPPDFTNLVPMSVNEDGTPFEVDGPGYDNGVYLSASGDEIVTKNYAATVTTGFIQVTPGAKIIRIAGEGLSIDKDKTRIVGYDENFDYVIMTIYKHMGIPHTNGTYYSGKLIDEYATLFTLELGETSNLARCSYLRVCVNGDGADLIVTVDEEITYGKV